MAWQIAAAVVRGEIDNRIRDRITGRIWLWGREDPVVLSLKGNARRDMAGRLLTFVNPQPLEMNLLSLAVHQIGVVGDVTASRKVKVPGLPPEGSGGCREAGESISGRWANALYLEWFSERNGRVVVEAVGFKVKFKGAVAWEMSAAEEIAERQANSRAVDMMMEGLNGVVLPEESVSADTPEPQWSGDMPMTEEEAEAMQARQDLLLDRVQARLDREGGDADYGQIMDEELERLRRERGEPESPMDWQRDRDWGEAVEQAAAEWEENFDSEWEARERYEHPLVRRAIDLAHALHDQADESGWVPEDAQSEHPVAELMDSTMRIGPKLAGALNGDRWPPPLEVCATTLVRIKRARGYIDDALSATESCQQAKLIQPIYLGPLAVELIDLAYEIDQLITELRERLERRR